MTRKTVDEHVTIQMRKSRFGLLGAARYLTVAALLFVTLAGPVHALLPPLGYVTLDTTANVDCQRYSELMQLNARAKGEARSLQPGLATLYANSYAWATAESASDSDSADGLLNTQAFASSSASGWINWDGPTYTAYADGKAAAVSQGDRAELKASLAVDCGKSEGSTTAVALACNAVLTYHATSGWREVTATNDEGCQLDL